MAIVGPTASGKSALAMAVAEAVGGEIVCCDSVQVYRGFEIGSAAPTAKERERVPHHGAGIVEPSQPFDAMDFRQMALQAIHAIRGRGRVPILCGGTGLYLRTLRWGLIDSPPADEDFRAQWMAKEGKAPGSILRALKEHDPQSAEVTEANNLVHLLRALEITLLSGTPASQLKARHAFAKEEIPMRVFYLDWPAEVLRTRIAQRTAMMLQGGWPAEVSRLLGQGVTPHHRAMRAVGYREVCAAKTQTLEEQELIRRIIVSTARYAKRQRTWFRSEKAMTNLPVAAPLDLENHQKALVEIAAQLA